MITERPWHCPACRHLLPHHEERTTPTPGVTCDRGSQPETGLQGDVPAADVSSGRIKRGYLGVSSQPVRLPAAIADMVGQETALLIVGIQPGSPAEEGDLLIYSGDPGPVGQSHRTARGRAA